MNTFYKILGIGGLCIMLACITVEYIDDVEKPSPADIRSITQCSMLKYANNPTSQRIQTDLIGKWNLPDETDIFFDAKNNFYIVNIDNVIVSGGTYAVELFDGVITLDLGNATQYEIRICGDIMYNIQLDIIWLYECRCGI